MSDPGAVGTPELRLRTMRVVVGALCAGVLSFAAIAVWVRTSGGTPPPPTPLISYVSLAFAGVAVLLALFLPGALAASWRRQVAREGGAVPPPPGEPTGTDLRWWGFFQTR